MKGIIILLFFSSTLFAKSNQKKSVAEFDFNIAHNSQSRNADKFRDRKFPDINNADIEGEIFQSKASKRLVLLIFGIRDALHP